MVTTAMKLRHLLLGRKAMTDVDSILKKQRHFFANKGPSSQSYGFPVVMYGCESWTISRKLSDKELMFQHQLMLIRPLRALGLQEDPTSPS